MAIAFLNSFRQWLGKLLYLCFPELFPAQKERDELKGENEQLWQQIKSCQDSLYERSQALGVLDHLHGLDREQWHGQFDLLANEIVAKNKEISALKGEVVKLEEAAEIDPLTGLANRRGIKSQFMREFAPLARSQAHPPRDVSERRDLPVISLAALDIDHFKKINDQYGHQAGDTVLGVLSTLMRSEMGHRIGDIHGRAGGEEFFVVLPTASTEQAYAQAEAFRLLIECSTFTVTNLRGEKVDLKLTLSCGISTIEVTDERKPPSVAFEQLYTLADRALYAAKHNGRNQVIRFDQLP